MYIIVEKAKKKRKLILLAKLFHKLIYNKQIGKDN